MINCLKILNLLKIMELKWSKNGVVHSASKHTTRVYYKHHMKTESITWNVTDSHSFDDMLDYGTCNVTCRLDKIERLSFELDYEVMDVTTQIFINFS